MSISDVDGGGVQERRKTKEQKESHIYTKYNMSSKADTYTVMFIKLCSFLSVGNLFGSEICIIDDRQSNKYKVEASTLHKGMELQSINYDMQMYELLSLVI